jgi:hypothetical protein
MGSPILKHKFKPLLKLSHTIFVFFSEAVAPKITQILVCIKFNVVRENKFFSSKNCYFLVSGDQVKFWIVGASTIQNVPLLCLASLLVVNAYETSTDRNRRHNN